MDGTDWCMIGVLISNTLAVMALAGVKVLEIRPLGRVLRNGKSKTRKQDSESGHPPDSGS